MEVFLHCNVCGHSPFPTGMCEHRRYFITNCGHVACINCCGNWKDKCGACKAPCKYVEINKDASSDVKAYFVDSMSAFEDSVKKFHKIFAFHMAQTKRNYARLMSSVTEAQTLKKENENLRNEVAEYQRQLELLKSEQQRSLGAGAYSSSLDTSFNSLGTPFSIRQNTPPPSYGNRIHFAPGRLTPIFQDQSLNTLSSSRSPAPSFFATPQTGRPMTSQTPDIVTRLRQMRCTAATPMGDVNSNNGSEFRR